jgi:breast cancer 2 susceptibility protein
MNWKLWECAFFSTRAAYHYLISCCSNISELIQISPATALYYSFHTASSFPLELDSPVTTILGASAALQELRSMGCILATKPWVDNHWSLILWKMAGMACLEPRREQDPNKKVWCWSEVMRQLRYRFVFFDRY